MKIILVNPPVAEWGRISRNWHSRAELNIVPPLGIAYIAAMLEQEGLPVKLFDCTVDISHTRLIELIREETPDILGITSTTPTFLTAKEIAKAVHQISAKSIIVIGGPHVTALPEEVGLCDCFDIGIVGEGEITFLELVRHISESGLRHLEDVDGIAYRNGGRLILNKARSPIKNLDDLPFPARHLLPSLSRYLPTPVSYRRLPVATVITSRGCPMNCIFCDKGVFGSSFRARDPDNIIDEMEEAIKRFGAREICFYDDIFTLYKDRIFKFCRRLKERHLKILWTCLSSANCVSRELLIEMRKSGCWQIWFGLESGNERVLRGLKKGISVAENIQAVKWAKEAGLNVRATFAIGSPWETKESLKETLNFAKRLKLDYAHFIKYTPYPGSELYDMLTRKGYHFDFTKGYDVLNSEDILYVPNSLNRDELAGFLRRAKREFYLRLPYIFRRLISIRTWQELKAHIISFLSVRGFVR
jgi:radical SAM superfamily enzyme YgiQ (UPF0313 family)